MRTPAGLVLSFVSAVAINWAYARQHDVVSEMPRFSLRRPLRLLGLLLRSRAWVASFLAESVGWLVYLAALVLAPIALVQGTGASGIVVLAFVGVQCRPSRLPRGERLAVGFGFAGLVLLAASLVDTTQADVAPGVAAVALWLAAAGAGAAVLVGARLSLARAASLGLASGLLFGAGDICSKLVVFGGGWLATALPLLAFYAAGTAVLQAAFQHGGALIAAGLSTLATNAVPIAAGFSVFGERLPHDGKGVLQLVGFGTVVVGAALLARLRTPEPVA